MATARTKRPSRNEGFAMPQSTTLPEQSTKPTVTDNNDDGFVFVRKLRSSSNVKANENSNTSNTSNSKNINNNTICKTAKTSPLKAASVKRQSSRSNAEKPSHHPNFKSNASVDPIKSRTTPKHAFSHSPRPTRKSRHIPLPQQELPLQQSARQRLPEHHKHQDAYVALSISDTPIIRRNQTLRQSVAGRRRSSLTLRGKRVSSLGDGLLSQPHPEISDADFYKHINVDLPDPLRMRQLLIWCGTKAINGLRDQQQLKPDFSNQDRKPPSLLPDANAIAVLICQEVIKDLVNSKLSVSWYHREPETQYAPLKPHPSNIANTDKLVRLKKRLADLQTERQAWPSLIESLKQQLSQSVEFANHDNTVSDLQMKHSHYPFLPLEDDKNETTTSMENIEIKIDQLHDRLFQMQSFCQVADNHVKKISGNLGKLREDPHWHLNQQQGMNDPIALPDHDAMDVLRAISHHRK